MTATTDSGVKRWFKRIGWLVLIWAGSVLTLAVMAYALRLLMQLAGL